MKRRESLIFVMNRDVVSPEIDGRTETAGTFVPHAGDNVIRLPSMRRQQTYRPSIPFTMGSRRRRRRA